jgi:hypothetical protein
MHQEGAKSIQIMVTKAQKKILLAQNSRKFLDEVKIEFRGKRCEAWISLNCLRT